MTGGRRAARAWIVLRVQLDLVVMAAWDRSKVRCSKPTKDKGYQSPRTTHRVQELE